MVMTFRQRLGEAIRSTRSHLCVGLDYDPDLAPKGLPPLEFNFNVVMATREHVAAYKLNLAFYLGVAGCALMQDTVAFIREKCPDIIIIGDAKFGDVAHANMKWAKYLFDYLGFDAVIANPWGGLDSLPLRYAAGRIRPRGVFVWCLSSGGIGIQEMACSKEYRDDHAGLVKPLAVHVARQAAGWGEAVGLVVGAGDLEMLKKIRAVAPQAPLLVPGIGAQGGDLEATVEACREIPFLISSSRSVIYAGNGEGYAEAAGDAARDLRARIEGAL